MYLHMEAVRQLVADGEITRAVNEQVEIGD